MAEGTKENWGSGGPYEQYVGRWSRKVAREFVDWLGVPAGEGWGDVGCGTGALVDTSSPTRTRKASRPSIGRTVTSPRRGGESRIRECALRSAVAVHLFRATPKANPKRSEAGKEFRDCSRS